MKTSTYYKCNRTGDLCRAVSIPFMNEITNSDAVLVVWITPSLNPWPRSSRIRLSSLVKVSDEEATMELLKL